MQPEVTGHTLSLVLLVEHFDIGMFRSQIFGNSSTTVCGAVIDEQNLIF